MTRRRTATMFVPFALALMAGLAFTAPFVLVWNPGTCTSAPGTVDGRFISPQSSVKVECVQAILTTQNGTTSVTFSMTFRNSGSIPITVVGACFTSLQVAFSPNPVLSQPETSGVTCMAITIHAVEPGQSYTVRTLQGGTLLQSGTVEVDLQLKPQSGPGASVLALFTFP